MRGDAGSGQGGQAGKFPRCYPGQSVSVAFLWDECECCSLAASSRLDQAASGQPLRQVGGLGPRQGCWADRGAVDVPVHPGVPLCVPATVTFCQKPVSASREEEEVWLPELQFNVGLVCRSCRRRCLLCGSACDQPGQCPVWVCMCVSRARAQLSLLPELANPPGQGLWVPRHQQLGQTSPGSELQEVTATPNTP